MHPQTKVNKRATKKLQGGSCQFLGVCKLGEGSKSKEEFQESTMRCLG